MNSTTLETVSGHGAPTDATLIDSGDPEGPIPVPQLKSALKKAAEHSVFGVVTRDACAEPNLRDFCNSTGNAYLGVERFDGHDIHYVKKRVIECQRCSNLRVVTLGLAAVGALAYTAPQVVNSTPSGIVTVAFAVALASLPPVLINNLRLLKQTVKKSRAATTAAKVTQ